MAGLTGLYIVLLYSPWTLYIVIDKEMFNNVGSKHFIDSLIELKGANIFILNILGDSRRSAAVRVCLRRATAVQYSAK